MRELTLQEIQKASLNVLVRTERILRKYDLQYFLAYGTLLGAVRHQGFIPWDDDIDIWMPRRDVDKLISIMEKREEEFYPLKVITRKNTLNYDYGILRITDLSYVYQNNETQKKKVNMGVFIDIYPIDNYGNSIEEGKKLYEFVRRMNTQYKIYVNPISFSYRFHTVGKWLYSQLLHIQHGNHWNEKIDRLIEEYIREKTSYQDSYVGTPVWDPFGVRQYEKDLFADSDRLPFEGYEFNVPKQYDRILTMIYGDYMQLPPEDKRVPHHNYKIWKK